MSKVLEFTVTHFRGIADPVTINMTHPRTAQPTSLILYGDNGSGKSSLVDAIEFTLRGRLSRRNAEGRKVRREVRNLAIGGAPGVAVTLDSGSSVKRGGGRLEKPGSQPADPTAIIDGFQFSPIIIRRQDIESFWRVPESERQAFFFDYLHDYGTADRGDTSDKLRAKLQKASDVQTIAISTLTRVTDFAVTDLPTKYAQTRRFFEQKIVPRYGLRQTGGRRRVPPRIHKAFVIFQSTLKDIEDLDDRLRELPETEPISDRDLMRVLQNVAVRVTSDFQSISRLTWIKEVVIIAGSESQLSIRLILSNGNEVDPVQLLSEAALDLLALLILVEVHIECATLGQSPVIVLDDVFQSVDTVHRIRTLDHILLRLAGWQIIIALHDRLWLELVKRAMSRTSHPYIVAEVLPGRFGASPQLRHAAGRSVEELRAFVEQRLAPEVLANSAGRVLEELCDGLSISLACKIARRPGDRYTLGDLWPGVASSLRKHGSARMRTSAEDVGRFIDLRNISGAHYNEWAASLALQEALEFASATVALWDSCLCPKCGALFSKFVAADGKSDLYTWPCSCGLVLEEATPSVAT